MKNTFFCPICKKEIEVGEWGKQSQSYPPYEYRLSNKRYHMKSHKNIKQIKHKISIYKKKIEELNSELSILRSVFGNNMKY